MNMLSHLFSSKTKAGIFRVLFGWDPEELHSREIARRADMNLASVQQELKRLESLDLVIRRKDGNRVYFKANQNHPLFDELHLLTLKTTGIVPAMGNALESVIDQIDYAFIFGSIARSEEKAHSDIDVMVIGTLGLREITALIGPLTNQLQREINPHTMTLQEFRNRLEEGDVFTLNIAISNKLFIVGDGDEFIAAAGRRLQGREKPEPLPHHPRHGGGASRAQGRYPLSQCLPR